MPPKKSPQHRARWIGQRNQNDCGPVALMNVCKWLGAKHISYVGSHTYFKLLCHYCPRGDENGTFTADLLRSLRQLCRRHGGVLHNLRNPTATRVGAAAAAGKLVVIDSSWEGGHFFLVAGAVADSLYCVNYAYHRHGWISKPVFTRRFLRTSKSHNCPRAFTIELKRTIKKKRRNRKWPILRTSS